MSSQLPIVEDISADLPTVKWKESTLTNESSSLYGATSYTGDGSRWAHTLVVWKNRDEEACDGAAVSLTESKGLIVHYTPSIAKEALRLARRTT